MNNILVINGSPKGKNSITLHTCLFLEKKFPGYKFNYLDAGQRIKVLEKDFSPALEAIREADLLHRFSPSSVSLGTKTLENVPAGVLEFLAGNKNGCSCSRSETLKQL